MRLLRIFLVLFVQTAVFLPAAEAQVQNADDFEKNIALTHPSLLDVRTEKEFRTGHISDALQANWNDTAEFHERIKYLDRAQPVYVYCLAGSRSAAAAAWMRSQGFSKVIELAGGINAWKKAGKPVQGMKEEKQISLEAFQSSIPAKGITLVDIGAEWCPPCRQMQPIIQKLKQDPALHFTLLNIDAGTQTGLLKALKVDPIPVFIVYRNGKETWRKEGVVSAEELKKHLQ